MLRPIVGDNDFALLVTLSFMFDKVLSVGDIFVFGFAFLKYFLRGAVY